MIYTTLLGLGVSIVVALVSAGLALWVWTVRTRREATRTSLREAAAITAARVIEDDTPDPRPTADIHLEQTDEYAD